MVELLSMFTLEQIFIVLILTIGFVFGLWKGFLSIWDRWKDYRNKIAGEQTEQERVEEIRNNILTEMDRMGKQVDILINSDRARIKGEILRAHTDLMIQGFVDLHTLEYLNQQFQYYKAEDGNSFVDELMRDINELPNENKIFADKVKSD